MGDRKIGAIISLDGEKEFKSAVTSVNKSLSAMKSEMSLVKAECDGEANTLASLAKKHGVLTKILEGHKKKEEEIAKGLEHAKQSYAKVGDGLEALKKQYAEASAKMEGMKKDSGATEGELKKQEKAVAELAAALERGKRNYETAGNRIKDWETKLNTAKAQTIKANAELNKNAAYMKEAERATDKCAQSIDAFGKETRQSVEYVETFKEKVNRALAGKLVTEGIDKIKELGFSALEMAKDADAAGKQVQASTGASAAAAKGYGKVIDSLYRNNYGDDFNDLAEAMSKVKQGMKEIDDASLENAIENAIALRDTFGMDMDETVRGANSLMYQFGLSATEAFDLLGKGAQSGLNYTNELGDNVSEYAGNFAQAGYSASEYFQLLKNGAGNGAYNLDKVNDAINEATNRLADGSVEKGLGVYSKGTQELFREWQKGGASQKEVIDSVVKDIKSCKNEQEALTMASTMFGTMGEDSNLEFIKSLEAVGDAFGKTKGAMEGIKDVKYSDLNSQITEIGRAFQMQVADKLEERLPQIRGMLSLIGENVDGIVLGMGSLATAMLAVKTASGLFGMAKKGMEIKDALVEMASKAKDAGKAVSGTAEAAEGAGTAFAVLKTAMAANPVAAVAVAAGVGATAFLAYKSAVAYANSEMGKFMEASRKERREREASNDAINSSMEAREQAQRSAQEEWAQTEVLGEKLLELNKVEKKTAAQKEIMNSLVGQLSDKVPGLAQAYDEEAGKIKMADEALRGMIETSKQAALAEAAKSRMADIAKDVIEAEMNLNEGIRKQGEIAEKIASLREKANRSSDYREQTKYYKEIESYTRELNKQEKQNKKLDQTYKDVNKELDKTSKYWEKSTEALEENRKESKKNQKESEKAGKAAEKSGKKTEKAAKDMADAEKSAGKDAGDMYQGVKKAFEKAEKQAEASGKKISAGTKKSFNGAADNAKKAGVKIPKGLAEGIESGKITPETAIKKVNKAIIKHGEGLAKEARALGVDIPDSISSGIAKGGSEAVAAIASLNSLIGKKQEESKEPSKKNGEGSSDAMASGIKSGAGKVSGAAGSVMSAAKQSAGSRAGEFYGVGKNIASGTAAGIRAGESAAINAAVSMVRKSKNAANKEADSHSPSRVFRDQVGLMLALGAAEGIRLGEKDAVSASVDMCRAVLKSSKEELEIASPSKTFKKNVGKQIAKGVAFGIREGKGEAKKSASELSSEVYNAAKGWLKKYKKSHKTSLDDEEYYWQTVKKKLKKGTDEYKAAADRIENVQLARKVAKSFGVKLPKKRTVKNMKEYYGEIVSAAEKYMDNMKVTHSISLAQEEAYWAKVVKKVKKGTQAWYDAKKKLKEAKAEAKEQKAEQKQQKAEQKQEKREYGLSGSGLEAYKTFYNVSAKAEIQYWATVLKQTKKGTAEYVEVYGKLAEAREAYNDRMEELNEEYKENCQEVNEQLEEDINDLTEAYKDAVRSRKDEILASTSLFDKFESTGVGKDELMYNLKTQVAGIALWEQQLEELGNKGLSKSLMEQLKAMGPEAAANIYSLNQMTDAELKEYNRLWAQKEALAESQAVKENESLRKETEDKIKAITKEAQAQLDAYKAEYEKSAAELSAAIEKPLLALAKKATSLGEAATLKLINGIKNKAKKKDTKETLKAAVGTVAKGLNGLPAEGKSIGKNTLDGILNGLLDKKKIKSAASDFVAELKAAIKKEAKINSPSGLFRDEVGKMIPAGIGEGIREGTKDAAREAENMVQGIMEEARQQTQAQQGKVASYAAQIDASGMSSLERLLGIPEQMAPVVNVDNSAVAAIVLQVASVMQEGFDAIKGLKVVTDTGALIGELQPGISRENAVQAVRRNRGRY